VTTDSIAEVVMAEEVAARTAVEVVVPVAEVMVVRPVAVVTLVVAPDPEPAPVALAQ